MSCLMSGIKAGYIDFNWKDYDSTDNFYVSHPDRFLSLLTGKPFTVTKENSDYLVKKNEYAVEFWSCTNGKSGHFAMTKSGFNSLQSSINVESGVIYSYRVFRSAR